jgi:hypothetical protein
MTYLSFLDAPPDDARSLTITFYCVTSFIVYNEVELSESFNLIVEIAEEKGGKASHTLS